jgi:predicted O-linked N-acetylglucosamine transferase (SPINDLY family)
MYEVKMEEQQYIQLLFSRLQSRENIDDILPIIEKKYNKSVILQYYIGYYYEVLNKDIDTAIKYYRKCLSLNHLFTPPYFSMGVNYIKGDHLDEAYTLFNIIFCKKTLDATSGTGRKVFNFKDNLDICNLLCPSLVKAKKYKYAEKMYSTFLKYAKEFALDDYRHIEGMKSIYFNAGSLYNNYNAERAIEMYTNALNYKRSFYKNFSIDEQEIIEVLDKKILQGLVICNSYVTDKRTFEKEVSMLYNTDMSMTEKMDIKGRKIRVGYMSPDFNKNAVGLFVTPLLKYKNDSKFEIYCYYNNKGEDIYTYCFKKYPNITWVNISEMSDGEVLMLMKFDHKIDILVDLISQGHNGRLDLIAMSPCPIIINYLGFPGSSYMNTVTHYITDKLTDPKNTGQFTENLLYMPRSFMCWHLFEYENEAIIKDKVDDGKVYLGIFNKLLKHSESIVKLWKRIVLTNKNYVLCFKLSNEDTEEQYKTLYKEVPNDQIKFLPFTETLDEYYDLYNSVDICMDTYPYSGTTTTCSSLYMGVPVFTIYKESNYHESNVSGGLLLNMARESGEDYYNKFVCKNEEEYIKKISGYNKDKGKSREEIREDFKKLMDPIKFMEEYENILEDLI